MYYKRPQLGSMPETANMKVLKGVFGTGNRVREISFVRAKECRSMENGVEPTQIRDLTASLNQKLTFSVYGQTNHFKNSFIIYVSYTIYGTYYIMKPLLLRIRIRIFVYLMTL